MNIAQPCWSLGLKCASRAYMARGIKEMEQTFKVHALEVKSFHKDDIQAVVKQCKELGINAVAGYAPKDAFPHILINEQLGNVVPSRLAFFYCMNKYLMRTLESNAFFFAPVDPLTETDDEILAKIPDDEWPFMLKNGSVPLDCWHKLLFFLNPSFIRHRSEF